MKKIIKFFKETTPSYVSGLLLFIFTILILTGIIITVSKYKNTQVIKTPTYDQGYYDGFSDAVKYLDRHKYIKGDTLLYIELKDIVNLEQKRFKERSEHPIILTKQNEKK
jgi:hypothetical protein